MFESIFVSIAKKKKKKRGRLALKPKVMFLKKSKKLYLQKYFFNVFH
jgi:hypothetical protein